MNPMIAGNLRSKTSWFAVALIVLGAAQQSGVLEFVPAEYKGLALSLVGMVTLVLRNLTTDGIADKAFTGDSNDQAG